MILDSQFSSLTILTTAEVRASIPIRSASGLANPFIFLSSDGRLALRAVQINSGRQRSRDVKVRSGL